jgi:hypothetical protein
LRAERRKSGESGIYQMEPGGTLLQQRGDIAYQMKKSLEGR